MKKFMGELLMTSTLLLGAVMPVVAHADENRTGTTNTTATFKANTTVVVPVDPTDPTKPIEPGEGNNGAQSGSGLSLIYAPGKIGFSNSDGLEIDTVNQQDYFAEDGDGTKGTSLMDTSDGTGTGKVGLQVSDQRGTSAGWTLSVSATDGTVASGNAGMSTLKGATYKLPIGTATSTGEGTDSGATARNGAVATGTEISVSGEASTASNGVLVGAASGIVLSAANSTGSGITTDLMDPSNILLRVPANAASAKTYTGTLNWTLSDTPAS